MRQEIEVTHTELAALHQVVDAIHNHLFLAPDMLNHPLVPFHTTSNPTPVPHMPVMVELGTATSVVEVQSSQSGSRQESTETPLASFEGGAGLEVPPLNVKPVHGPAGGLAISITPPPPAVGSAPRQEVKDGKNSTCENCGKKGHARDQCWEEGGRKAGKASRWFQNRAKGKEKEKGSGKVATTVSTTASLSAQTSTDSKPNGVWLVHPQDNDWLTEIVEEEILNPQDIITDEEDAYMNTFNHVLLAGKSLNSIEETILFDSGASCHMSSYHSKFLDYKPIIPKPITAADNHTFHAIGKGNLTISLSNSTVQTYI
ncbi:hypothetical protein M404DRAFT_30658 [Pisolithus tinctorius Marx 270]|uniref:CCHC-type domain-containing protein n=1 Tax=Pisolithus tinctorius Marx 270 TaxID=870435 RepID=A0A0C3JP16_PISTI|nr:hypothetical protein M404DRAFT_30658 [Pisolithus tinctorius Marx 270]